MPRDTCPRLKEVVEEHRTITFRKLKPHHQASLRAELTSPRGALKVEVSDFPLVRCASPPRSAAPW
jgi:hypothetical protein